MKKQVINPWTWQDKFGFVQANVVDGAGRVVFCSGQTAVDEAGNARFPGDIRAQINLAIDNLEVVLDQAGMRLSDVVRLNEYTTDIPAFLAAHDVLDVRLADCRPASTLLGVTSLAIPGLMVEFEATAAS